ncbi:MAG: glgB [Proteobacteria bacterium]|nr:glgB [Pseudomonadota bacterium]
MNQSGLSPELQQLVDANHRDPFAVLGRHTENGGVLVRALMPHAEAVSIAEGGFPMQRIGGTDVFEWRGAAADLPERYRLIWRDDQHRDHIGHDPYCYPPQLSDFDLHLFGEGKHWHAHRLLGARVHEAEGVAGILFSVWAPQAARVSVVGDFNLWDGRAHMMRVHGNGVWELFIPDLAPGIVYKYEIRARNGTSSCGPPRLPSSSHRASSNGRTIPG